MKELEILAVTSALVGMGAMLWVMVEIALECVTVTQPKSDRMGVLGMVAITSTIPTIVGCTYLCHI